MSKSKINIDYKIIMSCGFNIWEKVKTTIVEKTARSYMELKCSKVYGVVKVIIYIIL